MKLLKLLLHISLMFICIKDVTGFVSWIETSCRTDTQLIKLIGYDINLRPYINEIKNTFHKKFKSYIEEQQAKDNFIFYGESTMSFQCISQMSKICLHAKNLQIDETAIKIVYTSDGVDSKTNVPRVKTYDNKTEIIGLYFDDVLLPQYTYRLIMKFVGIITNNTGGFMKTFYRNDNEGEKIWLLAAADFRGAGARQIFPCWDEPGVRTKFNISINHPKNYMVLSNSPIGQKVPVITVFTEDSNDMVWTHFKTTYDISAYQVAIILSQLDHLPDSNVWYRKDVEQQIKFAQIVAINATSYLRNILNSAIFPSKVDHVIIPDFRDEGLESWGLVLYRESAVIYDEKLDSIGWKFEVARKVARKMVHQLFGNLVSPTSWYYLWLNEGIATFLAMKIVKEFVHSHLMDLLVTQYQHESFRLNEYYRMTLNVSRDFKRSNINSLFSFTYYVKAPVFIRSLLQVISTLGFETGLNRYLSMYQLRSVDKVNDTTAAFLDALEKAEVENSHELNNNLTMIMGQWTTQEFYPILQVTREPSGNKINITLQASIAYPLRDLWIPVTFTQNASHITEKRWLTPYEPIIQLTHINKNDWILVNVERIGYYRVNYDKDNWRKLMEYLNSAKYLNIHVLNRAQIIDDAHYFLLYDKLDLYFFKNLTNYLSNETDYVAWYPMFKIMEYASGFFPFSQSTEIKEHFQKILDSILLKISFLPSVLSSSDVFIECLRQEAVRWACILNSSDCKYYAFIKLQLTDTPSYITPGWKEWTYCNGLIMANNTFWSNIFQKYYSKLDNKFLEFLACAKNYTVIIHYIDLLKSGNFTTARERITVFHSIIARQVKNDVVFEYIINNFDQIVPSEIKTIIALTNIVNHLYSERLLLEFKNFVKNKFSPEIYSYVNEKIGQRVWQQIYKQLWYFESYFKTKS